MTTVDDFSAYFSELLSGSYDCADRVTVRGYFPFGQTSGGLLTWWNKLRPGEEISEAGLRAMAGDFARRVHAFARREGIPLEHCEIGDRTKHARAAEARPADPNFQGIFRIMVSRAPALVWQVWKNKEGKVVIRRPKKWPLVNNYHFHLIDPQWGT